MNPVIQFTQAHYPESDGKPMGETDEHRDEMVRHIELLRDHFRGQNVYVSGNLLIYYEQGNPKKFVVPDAFVVKGISPQKRRIFKTWVEKRVPDVVFETTSRKTRKKDTVDRPQLYATLGIQEYFLFDPDREYLEPVLQGHRLVDGKYMSIEGDASGRLVCEQLQMQLVAQDDQLQFYLLDNGERLLTPSERAESEAQRARQESERADAAEVELARLRAELARRLPT